MRVYLLAGIASMVAAAVVALVWTVVTASHGARTVQTPAAPVAPAPAQDVLLPVPGVRSEEEAARLRKALQAVPGVAEVEVRPGPAGDTARVRPAPGAALDPQRLQAAVQQAGPAAEAVPDAPPVPRRASEPGDGDRWAAVRIHGILDADSQKRLHKALGEVPGVTGVRIRPQKERGTTLALVKGGDRPPDLEALARAARGAGFHGEVQSAPVLIPRDRLPASALLERLCALKVTAKPYPATVERLRGLLQAVPGVRRAFVSPRGLEGPLYAAAIFGPDAQPNREAVLKAVRGAGYVAELIDRQAVREFVASHQQATLAVEGVANEADLRRVQATLREVPGVAEAQVERGRHAGIAIATVRFREGRAARPRALVEALVKAGFHARLGLLPGLHPDADGHEPPGEHHSFGGLAPPAGH
ncbi:MAG: hypothetical protein HY320_04090 [Armatimonadetes bacterium]|nr:hypothetical protein [Armatimonadota bacterium]